MPEFPLNSGFETVHVRYLGSGVVNFHQSDPLCPGDTAVDSQ